MLSYHVPSGSYYIGPRRPILLQAFLGTCVGVTVVDRTAGVGGLSHLLLPEPVSPQSLFQPEKYASNGLPLFIDALCAAGAHKPDMEASLSGGALLVPFTQQDLDLNIGGRTAEVAKAILDEAGIAIAQSETGGVFSCCIRLDMQTLTTSIEPTGIKPAGDASTGTMPTVEEIHEAMERLNPIPQVVLKLLRLLDREDFDILAVSDEVRQDQVISAMTLKLSNSVMFGRHLQFDTIDQALIYLGKSTFIRLVVSAGISNLYTHLRMGYSLTKGGLYHHAVGTAVIAEKLATLTGRSAPAVAFTAGLLHDIGKVVLDQYVADAHPLFYRNAHEEAETFIAAEKTLFGIDHAEVGSLLARRWGFPGSLIDAIAHQHAPENAARNPELVHLVHLADLLMSQFLPGLEYERIDTGGLVRRLARVGLSSSRFQELVDLIPEGVFRSAVLGEDNDKPMA